MREMLDTGSYGDVLNFLNSIPTERLNEYYLPLTDVDVPADYAFRDRYAIDGEPDGLIYGANVEAMVYNRAVFAEAGIDGVPLTRSELLAACEALSAIGVTPIQSNMGARWPMQQWDKAPVLFSRNENVHNDMLADDAPFDEGSAYGDTILFVNEMMEAGCFESNQTDDGRNASKDAFARGEIGMWFLANWSVLQIIAAAETQGLGDISSDIGNVPAPNCGGLAVRNRLDARLGTRCLQERQRSCGSASRRLHA